MTAQAWEVIVTGPARADLRDILRWTARQFGSRQRAAYAARIEASLRRLAAGPELPGSRPALANRPDLRRLRLGRNAAHSLFYRATPGHRIEVLRVLHDAMDPAHHLPP